MAEGAGAGWVAGGAGRMAEGAGRVAVRESKLTQLQDRRRVR